MKGGLDSVCRHVEATLGNFRCIYQSKNASKFRREQHLDDKVSSLGGTFVHRMTWADCTPITPEV